MEDDTNVREVVLIAEEYPGTRAFLGEIFGRGGYRCVLASNAGQALEIFRRERPALVVLSKVVSWIDLLKEPLRGLRRGRSSSWPAIWTLTQRSPRAVGMSTPSSPSRRPPRRLEIGERHG